MSMQPRPWPGVPALTARVAGAAFPGGSLAIRVRDELGAWCPDEAFAGVYGVRGAPGISPAQLAVVTALQFAEDLTDRQAADAVRGRIDWKYCLGLELADAGFDFSVLSEFRGRLVAGSGERLLLDLLLARLKELGLVKAGGRARTDSTHVLARIRDLNRLELAGESVRAALEALAAVVPGWLGGVIDASWQRVYGQRIVEMRLPDAPRRGRGWRCSTPATATTCWNGPGRRGAARGAGPARDAGAAADPHPAVLPRDGPGGEKVTWREDEHGLPPGRARIVSRDDPDARYGEKRGEGWLGYKAHYTETVSDPAGDDPVTGTPAYPSLVTDTETTDAGVPDVKMTRPDPRPPGTARPPPGEHVTDSGYASAEERSAAESAASP